MCSLKKMEEEDPNRDPTRAHFQRLSPMAVAYVLPILKMEEEDPNRDPIRAHFQRLPPWQWLMCSLF